MADEKFESLADYESFIQRQIEDWSPARRTALAAAMAERWRPAYEMFSNAERWGDSALLRQGLAEVWVCVRDDTARADWSRLKKQLHAVTPHMDDFDANEALCACVILQYALDCCEREDNVSRAVMAVLSGLEAARPDLLTVDRIPARWWKQASLQRELSKQLRLIEHIGALIDFKEVPQVLQPFLTDPAIRGEVRPRKAPQASPVLSNQVAFEMYKRMVQSDIRGAARNLDPHENPELTTVLYLATWLGRYRRRQQLISGEYGALADQVALDLLVAQNRARDRADPDRPEWDAHSRWLIDTCYHNSHNGLDVSAVEEPHGYGPSLRRLWVEAKRQGLSDADAWDSIRVWAYHEPAAWNKRRKKNPAIAAQYLERPMSWQATGKLDLPWRADVAGEAWFIRLNDFPDELMYSLLIGDTVAHEFNNWPKAWPREAG